MLRNGTLAPAFTLQDSQGQSRALDSLRGGAPLLISFFRGAFCPTARMDLMRYANVHERLTSVGAHMVAISTDTQEHHQHLRQTLDLPFVLLSDPGFTISEQYGVYKSDDRDGPQPHGEPAVFILDTDGKIAYSQVQTGPKGSASPADMVLILLYMSHHGGHY